MKVMVPRLVRLKRARAESNPFQGPYHYAKDANGLNTAPVYWQAQVRTLSLRPGSFLSLFEADFFRSDL